MIDIWSSNSLVGSVDFRLASKDKQSVREMLLKESIKESDIELIIPDVQVAIDFQKQENMKSSSNQIVLGPDNFFESYHTLDEIQEYIDDLAAKYPDIVEPFWIGYFYLMFYD